MIIERVETTFERNLIFCFAGEKHVWIFVGVFGNKEASVMGKKGIILRILGHT